MKKFLVVLVVVLLSANAAFAVSDELFQTALLQSLMQGEYDGVITVKELKTYGDTGIGTFTRQSVNGELIMLNGAVYRAKNPLWRGPTTRNIDTQINQQRLGDCNRGFSSNDHLRLLHAERNTPEHSGVSESNGY